MKRFRHALLGAVGLILALLGWQIVTLPLARVVEGPPPPIGENQVALENGTMVRQTLALPMPAPREIAPRIWVQLLPTAGHVLRARAESAGQVLGQTDVPLPALDQAFHRVQMPWWRVPPGASHVTLILEGHGVIMLATAIDRVAGGDLEINGVSHAPSDIAIQLVSGDRGIERYLPLSRIAAGKPGVLGWPRITLIWIALYLGGGVALLGSSAKLVRRTLALSADDD